jgi:hypothetical protein
MRSHIAGAEGCAAAARTLSRLPALNSALALSAQALCSLLIGSYFFIKLPGMGELLALVPDKCACFASAAWRLLR